MDKAFVPAALIRFLAVVGAVCLLLVLLAFSAGFYLRSSQNRISSKTILEMDLRDGVGQNYPSGAGSLFLKKQPAVIAITQAIDAACRDKRVVGLIGRIGGSQIAFADVQEIRDAVKRFRESGKTAVAFAESFSETGSGNSSYYLAASFDSVFMQPSGTLGLTGIISEAAFYRKALDKLGVIARLGARKDYKTYRNQFLDTAFTPQHKESSLSIIESVSKVMSADIAKDRDMDESKFNELVSSAPYTGPAAFEAGLVDGLAYRDQVFERMRRDAGKGSGFLYLNHYMRKIKRPKERGKSIALVYGEGAIVSGKTTVNPISSSISMGSESVSAALRAAVKDKSVGAVIFRVNSPGGSYNASDEIWREVKQARSSGKPVVVSMGAVAGSGGYFVSMDADRIIAHPSTITGSIGVVSGKFVATGLFNMLGITFDDVLTSPNADIWSPLHDYSEEQWSMMQSWLDTMYNDFVTRVSQARKIDMEEMLSLAQGKIYTGAQAVENGLVDTLGGFYDAVASAKHLMGVGEEKVLPIKVFPRRKSLLERLFGNRARSSEDVAEVSAMSAYPRLKMDNIFNPVGDILMMDVPNVR
ncbi:MAG: signal peptide peptidase SppA [Chitinispirillales bacterium]|jgi:protease-4|nr:signal peptide peptidase SppA [Chitinispirillales bacterium]